MCLCFALLRKMITIIFLGVIQQSLFWYLRGMSRCDCVYQLPALLPPPHLQNFVFYHSEYYICRAEKKRNMNYTMFNSVKSINTICRWWIIQQTMHKEMNTSLPDFFTDIWSLPRFHDKWLNKSPRGLKGIQEYLQKKIISQNLAETTNKFLIFLKLNAWYTLNVLETVEHS